MTTEGTNRSAEQSDGATSGRTVGRFVPVTAMPSYQLETVLHRTLVDTAESTQGEVWLQELAPGANLPAHQHSVDEIIVILGGTVEATLGERQEQSSGEAVLIVPAGMLHTLRNAGSNTARLLVFFPSGALVTTDPSGDPMSFPWQQGTPTPPPPPPAG